MTARILVVDDEPDLELLIVQRFRRQIRDGQFSFTFADDGVNALAALSEDHTIDMVLCDINMPRMDGREAIAEIKRDPALRQIPIVVLTTSKAEEDIYRTYDLGVSSYVVKPVTFQALVDVMADLGRYWFELVELPEATAVT